MTPCLVTSIPVIIWWGLGIVEECLWRRRRYPESINTFVRGWSYAVEPPLIAGPMMSVTFATAFKTPFPRYLFPPSRNSTASWIPVDAPDGTDAVEQHSWWSCDIYINVSWAKIARGMNWYLWKDHALSVLPPQLWDSLWNRWSHGPWHLWRWRHFLTYSILAEQQVSFR